MITKTLPCTYDQKYELLYQDMLTDISHQMQLKLPETKLAESCFWIGVNYWEKLKVVTHGFRDEATEINFFRNIKPQFTGYIEYFTILSEALLFVPEEKVEFIFYWEEQGRRYKRFYNKHEKFIRYYENGNHYMDDIYFLRSSAGARLEQTPKATIYDMDIKFRTSHDHLLRSYLANKLFYDYVRKKLGLIKNYELVV